MKILLRLLSLLVIQHQAAASHTEGLLWTSVKADFPQAALSLEFSRAHPGYRLKSLDAKSPDGTVTRLDQETLDQIGTVADYGIYRFGEGEDTGLAFVADFYGKHATGDLSVFIWYYWHGRSAGSELYRCNASGDDERWEKEKSSGGVDLYPVPVGDPRKFFSVRARGTHVVLRAADEEVTLEARVNGDALTSLSGGSGEDRFTVPASFLKGIRQPDLLSFRAMIYRGSPKDVAIRVAPEFFLQFNFGTGVFIPATADKAATTAFPRCSFFNLFTPDEIERIRLEPLSTPGNWLEYSMDSENKETLQGAHGYSD